MNLFKCVLMCLGLPVGTVTTLLVRNHACHLVANNAHASFAVKSFPHLKVSRVGCHRGERVQNATVAGLTTMVKSSLRDSAFTNATSRAI
eukprot:857348-Amphidinium_carterae.2